MAAIYIQFGFTYIIKLPIIWKRTRISASYQCTKCGSKLFTVAITVWSFFTQAMERARRDCGLGSFSCDSRVAASDRRAFCAALSGGRAARELAPVLRGLRMRIVPPSTMMQLQQAHNGRSEDGQHGSGSVFVLRESGLLLATPDAQVV